jgi:hypothetical protein
VVLLVQQLCLRVCVPWALQSLSLGNHRTNPFTCYASLDLLSFRPPNRVGAVLVHPRLVWPPMHTNPDGLGP